jgi:hypothetical protein
MEDEQLGTLFRAAREALAAEPCVVAAATEQVAAYVSAVRRRFGDRRLQP